MLRTVDKCNDIYIGCTDFLSLSLSQNYDDWEKDSSGMWMLCFSSEYELGQFEHALTKKYKEIFQVIKKMCVCFLVCSRVLKSYWYESSSKDLAKHCELAVQNFIFLKFFFLFYLCSSFPSG